MLLDRGALPFDLGLGHTADLVRHTEITLQDATNSKYQLKLLVGKQKIKLETKDNRIWTPVQRSYVPYFSLYELTEGSVHV